MQGMIMKVLDQRALRVGVVGVIATVLAVGVASSSWAQVNRRDIPIATQPQQRFNSGQDIQPIFEGWTPNGPKCRWGRVTFFLLATRTVDNLPTFTRVLTDINLR